jgi:FkbM family methyltransferase
MKKQRLLAEHIHSGTIFYDVGANVGVYTLLASLLSGTRGHVYSFEPVPRNIHYLKEHIRINMVSNASVIGAAVCDIDGEVSFSLGSSSSMGYVDNTGDIDVRALKLDTFCSKEKPPTVIKMDIEGAEHLALLGANETLRKCKPTIFLSTHGSRVHSDCCSLLEDIGYALTSVDGKPVEHTNELIGIFG